MMRVEMNIKSDLKKDLSKTMDELKAIYVKQATQEILRTFDNDLKGVTVSVDGKASRPNEGAREKLLPILGAKLFNPMGVKAINLSGKEGVDELRRAYLAAFTRLTSSAPRVSGLYASSIETRVNGKVTRSINWDEVTSRSVIQLYVKARHASPLESIKQGSLCLAARSAAKAAGGALINVSFKYVNPKKYKQHRVLSSSGRGRTPKGTAFAYLAVPLIEMGTVASNVDNSVGNVGVNESIGRIQASARRGVSTLITRKIVSSSRIRDLGPAKRSRKKRK